MPCELSKGRAVWGGVGVGQVGVREKETECHGLPQGPPSGFSGKVWSPRVESRLWGWSPGSEGGVQALREEPGVWRRGFFQKGSSALAEESALRILPCEVHKDPPGTPPGAMGWSSPKPMLNLSLGKALQPIAYVSLSLKQGQQGEHFKALFSGFNYPHKWWIVTHRKVFTVVCIQCPWTL